MFLSMICAFILSFLHSSPIESGLNTWLIIKGRLEEGKLAHYIKSPPTFNLEVNHHGNTCEEGLGHVRVMLYQVCVCI